MEMSRRQSLSALFLISALVVSHLSAAVSIGVNYGTIANNLPPPATVANFVKEKTNIDRIRIYDLNPDIIRAFANTGILVTVTIPNGDIPGLTNLGNALNWINDNIRPFVPATQINYILMGNEVIHWGPQNLIDNLIPAMRTLTQALAQSGFPQIKVTSPNALSILATSTPPSTAQFRPGLDNGVIRPMLQFLMETNGPFMVNPYPYFGVDPSNVGFSIFGADAKPVFDPVTKITYYNQYESLLDAVHVAMDKMGFGMVPIAIGETGWPSIGEPSWATVQNAFSHNAGVIRVATSGAGTPLMPKRTFETYLFALFNENLKPDFIAEKNFGLFRPDFSSVYHIGVLKGEQVPQPALPPPQPKPHPRPKLQHPHHPQHPKHGKGGKRQPHPKPAPGSFKKWCVPQPTATDAQLQHNIDYACSNKADCKQIQPGNPCFEPNNLRDHAAYAMNSDYQNNGRLDYQCVFSGTGLITTVDPSHPGCAYPA